MESQKNENKLVTHDLGKKFPTATVMKKKFKYLIKNS